MLPLIYLVEPLFDRAKPLRRWHIAFGRCYCGTLETGQAKCAITSEMSLHCALKPVPAFNQPSGWPAPLMNVNFVYSDSGFLIISGIERIEGKMADVRLVKQQWRLTAPPPETLYDVYEAMEEQQGHSFDFPQKRAHRP